MIRYIFVFLLILLSFSCFGQNRTISGYVYDSENNEKLIGAHVWGKNSKIGTATNGYGFFSLTFKQELTTHELIVSYIGYTTKHIKIHLVKDTLINIKLTSNNLIEEVEVTADLPIEKRTDISTVCIPKRDIEMLPAIAGERDIIKAYQMMPGVQSGSEGTCGLYVRGGSPDQNLILLDDVPIYYVNHLGGFTSIFNNDAINSTKLIKGGGNAQYGGRLSSVLDVKMKEGNNKHRTGSASIGLLSAKILAEGPIKKDTSSYLISVRRFMYDLLSRPISKLATGAASMGYTFYDINLKTNYKINLKNSLYLSAYMGDDAIIFRVKEKETAQKVNAKHSEKWGNIMTAARWNHLFNKKLFSNFILSYTRYRYKNSTNINYNGSLDNNNSLSSLYSSINDVGLKIDFDFFHSHFYTLKFGGTATYHYFQPAISEYQLTVNSELETNSKNQYQLHAFETGMYLENKLTTNFGLSLNLGARLSSYHPDKQSFYSLEPRLSATYLIYDKYQIRASYSKTQQYIHLLTNSGQGIPVDFWVPATPNVPPSKSTQYTFGFVTSTFHQLEFSCETYFKTMNNLITFKEGESYFGTNKNWEEKIETNGYGQSYGVEFLLQKKYGKNTGWIAYTYGKTTRQFNNINNGKTYPFKYDRTHDISIVFNRKISKTVDFSLTWVYGTGCALTMPSSKYYAPDINPENPGLLEPDINSEEIYIYTGKNAFRAEAYHRLDLGLNFRKEIKWGTRTLNLSIYNLYNRKNPYFYTLSTKPTSNINSNGNEKVYLLRNSLFPFIPSISYSIKFK